MKLAKYVRWSQFFLANDPFYIIFYINGGCNAKCAHCFNWKIIEDAANRNRLTLDEIDKITQNWGKTLIVNLAGGEPYMRKDIPEIVSLFKKNTGVEFIAIPSNGIMTDRILETINKCCTDNPDVFFRFSFSIDGLGEEHDRIRGIPGCFDKAIRTIGEVQKLKKKYDNFVVLSNTTFMSTNQDTVKKTLHFLKNDMKIDAPSMTFIRGDAKMPAEQRNIYVEKYKEAILFLESMNRESFHHHPLSKVILGATMYARQKVFENLETGRRNFECFAIKKMIVVEDDGEVKICEMMPTSLGNLRNNDYDIKRVVRSAFAQAEAEKIARHECNCTWECAIRTGVLYNPKEYVNVAKHAFLA